MSTQKQSEKVIQTPKDKLLRTVLEAVKSSITKENGVTFADVEDLFGNSKFRAALVAEMKVFF